MTPEGLSPRYVRRWHSPGRFESARLATSLPRLEAICVAPTLLLNAVAIGSLGARLGGVVFAGLLMLSQSLRRASAWHTRFYSLAVLAGVFGALLAASNASHAVIVGEAERAILGLIACGGFVGQVTWAYRLFSSTAASALAALPLAVPSHDVLHLVSVNPWKYLLAWPVMVVAVATARGSRWAAVVLLAALCGISLSLSSRSAAGICFVAMMFVALGGSSGVRGVFARAGRTARWLVAICGSIMLALGLWLGLGVYSDLALDGTFGSAIQSKQIAQSENGESVLVGGRPESIVTIGLFLRRPLGYGVGVPVAAGDIAALRTSVALHSGTAASFDGIVRDDGSLKLHSMVADLWYSFGLAGVGLAAVMFVRLARGARDALVDPNGKYAALLIAGTVWALWDLFFSPFYQNWYSIGFALGLAGVIGSSWTAASLPLKASVDGSMDGRLRAVRSGTVPFGQIGARLNPAVSSPRGR